MATKPIEKTEWAIDEDALITATDGQRWNYGWTTPNNDPSGIGEKPNLNQQNYWQNAVHKWKEYFETFTDEIDARLTSEAADMRLKLVPVGSIIAIASDLTGAFDAASGAVVDGFMFCDGTAIPAGKIVSGNTPVLNDNRFLMGSATAGSTGGANTKTIAIANLPSHSHSINHDHASFTSGSGGVAHTHSIEHNHPSATTSTDTHDHRAPVYNGEAPFTNVTQSPTEAYGLSGGPYNVWSNTDDDSHSHTLDLPNYAGDSGGASAYSHTHPINVPNFSGTSGTTGSGTALDILPQYLTVKYFIKVGV